ncbi:MAG: aldolase [Nitrospina sp.]|nr:MAG: aldolase [Nitrospina sp.]
MLKLMLITNQPDLAKSAVSAGVDSIFVDLEILGKQERQGHLDTVISAHSMDDVPKVRAAIPNSELLVRLNPPHEGIGEEIEQALESKPELLMLPMFHTAAELADFCEQVNGRAGVIPLVETPEAADCLEEIVNIKGLSEIYIGLNDLHLGLKQNFIFEPLANGMVDRMADTIKRAGLPFGFGGIARIGEGQLPGELVLGEHLRLGSSSVILSRTFQRGMISGEFANFGKLQFEIEKLRESEEYLLQRSPGQIELDRKKVIQIVNLLAQTRNNR